MALGGILSSLTLMGPDFLAVGGALSPRALPLCLDPRPRSWGSDCMSNSTSCLSFLLWEVMFSVGAYQGSSWGSTFTSFIVFVCRVTLAGGPNTRGLPIGVCKSKRSTRSAFTRSLSARALGERGLPLIIRHAHAAPRVNAHQVRATHARRSL